jgi:tetratricopeptide (TPR) repeat protein
LKAPTVDSIAVYLPTDTKIVSIDVYGAVLGQTGDGKVLYGKADKDAVVTDADGVLCEDATTAKKIYLGTITVPAAVAGAKNILAKGDFAQAMKVDYIYFALTMKGAGANAYYGIKEIELYGLNDGAEVTAGVPVADFTALNAAYDIYTNSIATDYTEATWNAVLEVIEQYKNVINSVLSAQADVTAAAEALDAALKALVLKPTDWTAIDAALATVADANAFTPATYETFKAVYDAVVALRAQANVPQSVADAALAELNTAIASLEKRANTTALKAALDEAKTLKEDEWNGDKIKWKMFANAIAEAEALLANENATQAQVDKVVEDLAFRKSELVKVEKPADPTPAPGDPVDPGDPGDGTEKPTEKVTDKETEKDTEKGTETEKETEEEKKGCGSSVALSALAIVGVIGTAVVLKKKED